VDTFEDIAHAPPETRWPRASGTRLEPSEPRRRGHRSHARRRVL
jgi:hypothetical protein